MAGMINNFYYGKAGRADYTPDQMPTTRVQLFFEMLRIHFSGLFGMNLAYLLFCLPAIAWAMLNLLTLNAQVELGSSPEVLGGFVQAFLVIMIPCLGLCGVGAPGLMYVMRNWARDQHAFTLSDFKDHIKGNWKQGLCVGLINGFMTLTAYVGYIFYGQQSAQSIAFVVPQMLTLMLCLFWWMINMVIYPMMVTYDMKLIQLIRNSAIIVLARLPWALLIFVISLLPAIAAIFSFFFLSNLIVLLVVALLYLLVGFALTGLGYASFANATFDKLINPRIEGAPVGMGMRDPSLDDDDEEEEEGQQA